MTPPLHDNALAALERARQAQERHERRIDVQLRMPWTFEEQLEDELQDAIRRDRLYRKRKPR